MSLLRGGRPPCLRPCRHAIQRGCVIILLFSLWIMCSIVLEYIPFEKSSSGQSLKENVLEENSNYTDAMILSMVPQVYHKYLMNDFNLKNNQSITHSWNGTTRFTFPTGNSVYSSSKTTLGIHEIKKRIEEINSAQTVLNEDIYGPLQSDSLVIVVQVHNRIMYLRHTIISLAMADGISNALIVFSHDYFNEEINALIQSIDFCKVMQIFYPYSIQTHPHEFPGETPNDCPRDIDTNKAVKMKCNNAKHPDSYGHYREAKFTQTKHHWWWKTSTVFESLNITKDFKGSFVFFEEDHYVAPDFIHMLHLMELSAQLHCPTCSILSLGSYPKTVNFAANSKKAEITGWISSKHNMGMAFNRSVWHQVRECARTFCTYDDYNWDWSLLAVSRNCFQHELTVMVLLAPRVYHIGECGVHHKNSCKSTSVLRSVQKAILQSAGHLSPNTLLLTRSPKRLMKKLKPNGGWGDSRDHNLCLKIVGKQ